MTIWVQPIANTYEENSSVLMHPKIMINIIKHNLCHPTYDVELRIIFVTHIKAEE